MPVLATFSPQSKEHVKQDVFEQSQSVNHEPNFLVENRETKHVAREMGNPEILVNTTKTRLEHDSHRILRQPNSKTRKGSHQEEFTRGKRWGITDRRCEAIMHKALEV
jgi:hypothetical protein